jgi:hypothetical protein
MPLSDIGQPFLASAAAYGRLQYRLPCFGYVQQRRQRQGLQPT